MMVWHFFLENSFCITVEQKSAHCPWQRTSHLLASFGTLNTLLTNLDYASTGPAKVAYTTFPRVKKTLITLAFHSPL
ncbi:hypothetical protein E2C01_051790 [Portunus trituberculatus]|uniref:Uncharacterized protein n=1 Tax=Portunus trituberculatus TaxID=210409 RepID=A0A5B7GFU2_PORTR|nr:hypothetical protein [Portunus trituberculatus]